MKLYKNEGGGSRLKPKEMIRVNILIAALMMGNIYGYIGGAGEELGEKYVKGSGEMVKAYDEEWRKKL